jgi:glycerophosphoryl diester phosphodiesterase
MEILSHRGYWTEQAERNQPPAFSRSFDMGFGTETDIRDRLGQLVVSHDPATSESLTLQDFVGILASRSLPLALNIKADGLAGSLRAALDEADITTAFVFDMSVPDTRAYFTAGIPVFARMSEVEQEPVWLDRSQGVWLDAFERLWYDHEVLERLLDAGKRVCVVSPELHARDHSAGWELLAPFADRPNLMLCTDKPEDATEYFGMGE